jgi:hypothetical protein
MPMTKEEVNKMTVQEACDYAVKQIVKQGKRAMEGSACCYEDNYGNHCAVGHLLEKLTMRKIPLDNSIKAVVSSGYSDLIPDLIRQNVEAFEALQRFHDVSGKDEREVELENLEEYIDVSGTDYKAWIALGK